MSSLRISHQSRAIGAATSAGETARSEAPADGASFVAALGAAGLVPKGTASALTGKQSSDPPAGDVPDGATAPRKPADGRGKADDATAALALEGSLGMSAADLATALAPTAGASRGSDNATPIASHAASGAASTATPARETASNPGAALAPEGFPVAASSIVAASHGPDNATPIHAQQPTAIAGVDATSTKHAASAAASTAPPARGTAPTSRATLAPEDLTSASASIVAASRGPGDAAPLNAQQPTAIAGVDATSASLAASAAASTPGKTSTPEDSTTALGPTDQSMGAVTEAAGPFPSLDWASAGPSPRPGAAPALPILLAALSGSIASVSAGEAGIGGATGGSGDDRGRFALVATAPDAGNVAAAATIAGTGETAALAAPPSAGPAMIAEPNAASAISDQVAGQLVRLVSSGSREMVMRLHPPELGDLTVRVAVSGREVTAWFASPQPEVQNAINQAIGQLQTGLGNAGYNLSGAFVGADASGGGRQGAGPSPLPLPAVPGITDLPLLGGAASQPVSSGMSIYV